MKEKLENLKYSVPTIKESLSEFLSRYGYNFYHLCWKILAIVASTILVLVRVIKPKWPEMIIKL